MTEQEEQENRTEPPNRAFTNWHEGLDQIQFYFGEKYSDFIRDFNEFKANGNIFSYAIAGNYVIVCPTYAYETDKYLKYIDENNLRDTYVQFDTTKYLDKCPGCGIFFNEKIVNTASGKTVHEKCLSGAICSPCYNKPIFLV